MYVQLQSTSDPIRNAVFSGLERCAFAGEAEELASRRAAWLEREAVPELVERTGPQLLEAGPRYWAQLP